MSPTQKNESSPGSLAEGVSLFFDPVTRLLRRTSQSNADETGANASIPHADTLPTRDVAIRWLEGFVRTSAAFSVAAVVPFAISSSVTTLLHSMALGIGRIYNGDSFDAAHAAQILDELGRSEGLIARVISTEFLSFVPIIGWAFKAATLTSMLRKAGMEIIEHFEKAQERAKPSIL